MMYFNNGGIIKLQNFKKKNYNLLTKTKNRQLLWRMETRQNGWIWSL